MLQLAVDSTVMTFDHQKMEKEASKRLPSNQASTGRD